MIITRDEQIELLGKYNPELGKSVSEINAFIDGMNAMMELVDSKLKSEK